ncbi:hypothetical protein [Tenacibaculum jejuense]|uniref:C1q domain-containing protein n=1 Tax=Tenacibaculum jejuense TaxID=584609 RepID=A0A238UD71_9FLAO|nr:hypothetical protein [Tenacibaculum jejuense]SNR16350.1 conserved protein of unknown function [Tenacibaculum jejuense]
MKTKKYLLSIALLLYVFVAKSQVLPGVPVSGFPSGTTAQIQAISSPVESVIAYSTDEKIFYYYEGTNWIPLNNPNSLKVVVLNRTGGYTLPNATNTYFDFPINAAHTQTIDSDVFTVTGNGRIRILQTGVYLISAELSTSDMPSGGTKYIIGAFRNGGLIGYLTRGFVTLPSQDWWGGTGVLMYSLNANDEITLRYVLNAGRTLTGRFMNIGITKMR